MRRNTGKLISSGIGKGTGDDDSVPSLSDNGAIRSKTANGTISVGKLSLSIDDGHLISINNVVVNSDPHIWEVLSVKNDIVLQYTTSGNTIPTIFEGSQLEDDFLHLSQFVEGKGVTIAGKGHKEITNSLIKNAPKEQQEAIARKLDPTRRDIVKVEDLSDRSILKEAPIITERETLLEKFGAPILLFAGVGLAYTIWNAQNEDPLKKAKKRLAREKAEVKIAKEEADVKIAEEEADVILAEIDVEG